MEVSNPLSPIEQSRPAKRSTMNGSTQIEKSPEMFIIKAIFFLIPRCRNSIIFYLAAFAYGKASEVSLLGFVASFSGKDGEKRCWLCFRRKVLSNY